MKTKLTVAFALLLALSIPSGSALALGVYDPIPIQIVNPTGSNPNQGVINGLNGVSNAINAQTQTLQDAQLKQQLATLDPACVSDVTAQYHAWSGWITPEQADNTRKAIMVQAGDMSDPGTATTVSYQIQNLDRLIGSQTAKLNNDLIKYCQKTTITQVQQTIPTPGLQCNGKSWNACPTGYNFSCPSSGNPTCTPQQQPQVAPPVVKAKPVVITNNTPLTKPKMPAVATSVASTSNDVSQPASAPVTQKKGLWAWFKSLFGF